MKHFMNELLKTCKFDANLKWKITYGARRDGNFDYKNFSDDY
jgi:hypothetical protein